MRDFGNKLNEYRERLGMKQKVLAERVGLTPGHFNKIEKGSRKPPEVDTVLAIADVLHLKRDEAEEFVQLAGYSPEVLADRPDASPTQQLSSAQSPAETQEAVLRQILEELQYLRRRLDSVEATLQELKETIPSYVLEQDPKEPVPSRVAREETSSNAPSSEIPDWDLQGKDKETENERKLREFREEFRRDIGFFRLKTGRYVWSVKGGLPTYTLPTDEDWYREPFQEEVRKDPDAGKVLTDRLMRGGAILEQLQMGVEHKYIISRSAIRSYIKDGVPSKDDYEAISPTWRAPIKERIARILSLMQFLEFDNFSLALSEVNYTHQWWFISQDSLFVELFEPGVGDPLTPSTFWWKLFHVKEGGKQKQLVKWYADRFIKLWDSLPSEAKDKVKIKEWLEGLLREIGWIDTPLHKALLPPSRQRNRFRNALAQAQSRISQSEGGNLVGDVIRWEGSLQTGIRHEWWVKGGLPTDTLPADAEWYQQLFLGRFANSEAKYVLDQRIKRVERAWEQVSQGIEQKYIIPRSAIERYVKDGIPNYDHYEALDPKWRAPIEERKARIENLIRFLQCDNYHLALTELDCDEIWWDIVDPQEQFFSKQNYREIWWGIYSKTEVLIEAFPRHTTPDFLLVRVAMEADGPQVVQLCTSIYEQLWELLPSEAEDKDAAVHWLQELLAEISS